MSRTERRRSKLESAARIGSVAAALAVVTPAAVAQWEFAARGG